MDKYSVLGFLKDLEMLTREHGIVLVCTQYDEIALYRLDDNESGGDFGYRVDVHEDEAEIQYRDLRWISREDSD